MNSCNIFKKKYKEVLWKQTLSIDLGLLICWWFLCVVIFTNWWDFSQQNTELEIGPKTSSPTKFLSCLKFFYFLNIFRSLVHKNLGNLKYSIVHKTTSLSPKVPQFFISQEKFKLVHFLGKVQLVSKKAVFSRAIFFPALEFELVSTV